MTSPLAAILCLTGILIAATSHEHTAAWIVFLVGCAVELSAHTRTPAD